MAKVLTAASIIRFKGGDKRQEIPDAACPGLNLIVQPTGAKSWAVRTRLNGRLLKFTIGKYLAGEDQARAGAELVSVRAQAADIIRQARTGADPREVKAEAEAAQKLEREEKAKESYEAVLRLFIKRHAMKRRTWRETARTLGLVAGEGDRDDIDTFISRSGGLVERWGARHVGSIKRAEIVKVLDEVVDAGNPIAANRRLAALRKMFNWCVARGTLAASPCVGIEAPGEETSRDRILSDDELRLLLKACAKVGGIHGDLTKLLLYTAQRRSECAEMVFREVDGDIWTIPAERSKNKKPHQVPLNAGALAVLDGRPRITGPGYAFTIGGGSPFSGFTPLKQAVDKALAELAGEGVEIAPWTLHDLRRTAASGMQRLGIKVEVVEKLLNHSSGTFRGIVGVYQRHDYVDEKRHAAEAWGTHLDGLLKEAPGGNVVPMVRAS